MRRKAGAQPRSAIQYSRPELGVLLKRQFGPEKTGLPDTIAMYY